MALPEIRRNALTRAKSSRPSYQAAKRISSREQAIKSYSNAFLPTLLTLPMTQQLSIIYSLLSHLDLDRDNHEVELDTDLGKRRVVYREALVLQETVGNFDSNEEEGDNEKPFTDGKDGDSAWGIISSVLERVQMEGVMRTVICWAAISHSSYNSEICSDLVFFGCSWKYLDLTQVLERANELWSDENHIKHSSLRRHYGKLPVN
jgi:hypothetical protein